MRKFRHHVNKYLLPVLFGAAIIGLSVFAIITSAQKEQYRQQLKNVYEKSLEDLVTDIGSLESKLGKLDAARSNAMINTILMDIWRQTGNTESSIAGMPLPVEQSAPVVRFVNRLGDYCRFLSEKISEGQAVAQQDLDQVNELKKTCAALAARLDRMWSEGYIPTLQLNEAGFVAAQSGGEGLQNTQTLDFSGQQYPQLQYDGPFSESTENRQPKGLAGNDVDEQNARQAAIRFLGQDYVREIVKTGDLSGTIPAHVFDGQSADGDFSIYITKKGGHVLYYQTYTVSDVQAIPTDERYEELTRIAIQYLKDKGYPDCKPSYAQFYNGRALINLAPVAQGVVLYPDLVKVWVDIERNRALGVESFNYLMNHVPRSFPQAKLTEEDARKLLNENLMVSSARLALIPTEQLKELLCWEFTGKVDDTDYIVYINAENGREEDILQIEHTNEGTLVM